MSDELKRPKKELDRQLDLLEAKISELKILYEQYFVDVQPQPPLQLQAEVVRLIKTLLRAPFKNSAARFRLRTLVSRFQTYHTYWERVNKQREEGTYFRDLFKAEMRERMSEEEVKRASQGGTAERGMRELYDSYESALRKSGVKTGNLDYAAFKKSLVSKAKELKQKHGVKKLKYKVVVRDGKVSVKATTA